MSRRTNSQKLDLKLNLSPPSAVESHNASDSSCEVSSEISCVSSEREDSLVNYKSCQETAATNKMVLVGCRQCLMYVMLSEVDLKCPQCKSTVLISILHEART